MLGVQRRTARRVRGNGRRLADLIGGRQLRTQLTRLARYRVAILAVSDSGQQLIDAFDQARTLGLVGQLYHQPLQHAEKLHLFAVFGVVDHLARLHRRRIVSANVVQ